MVAAISVVRDEADIVEATVRQMASQVDFLIVADNRSVDGTREILDALADELPLTVIDEPQKGHYQSQVMTALAGMGADRGAEWLVPFDGDEWFRSEEGRIADVLPESSKPVVFVPSYTHVATAEDDLREPDPTKRMKWRKHERDKRPKSACRALTGLTINAGNHTVSYGRGRPGWTVGRFRIHHFQWRSPEHFERKVRNGAAALAAAGYEDRVCFHWREYGAILREDGPDALRRVYYQHHYRTNPREEVVVDGERMPALIFDPVRASP